MQYDFRDDPILDTAFRFYQSKAGAGRMPRRRDIDPTEIPRRILPHLQITEMIDGGARIRYRLAGTAIVEAYGAELRGKYLDEVLAGERLRYVEAKYRLIRTEKRPLLVCSRYVSTRATRLVCNRVVMPLSEDGETVDACLTAMTFRHPGDAHQWAGEWFGNSGNFDYANSFSEIIQ